MYTVMDSKEIKGAIIMKTVYELKAMLFERLAEIKQGGLVPSYDEQCRIELALLYDILGEEIDEEYWDEIEENI